MIRACARTRVWAQPNRACMTSALFTAHKHPPPREILLWCPSVSDGLLSERALLVGCVVSPRNRCYYLHSARWAGRRVFLEARGASFGDDFRFSVSVGVCARVRVCDSYVNNTKHSNGMFGIIFILTICSADETARFSPQFRSTSNSVTKYTLDSPTTQNGTHRPHYHHHHGEQQRHRAEHRLLAHHRRPVEARPADTRHRHGRPDRLALQQRGRAARGQHVLSADGGRLSDQHHVSAGRHCGLVVDGQPDCQNAVREYSGHSPGAPVARSATDAADPRARARVYCFAHQ